MHWYILNLTEQAKWVAHIILPDVVRGNEGRSNDFRPDSLIKTGSATEADYFCEIPCLTNIQI